MSLTFLKRQNDRGKTVKKTLFELDNVKFSNKSNDRKMADRNMQLGIIEKMLVVEQQEAV